MGFAKRLAVLSAVLALSGCDTATNRTYHITCFAGGQEIYQGDVTSPNYSFGTIASFHDEDGQWVQLKYNCSVEENHDRSAKN